MQNPYKPINQLPTLQKIQVSLLFKKITGRALFRKYPCHSIDIVGGHQTDIKTNFDTDLSLIVYINKNTTHSFLSQVI